MICKEKKHVLCTDDSQPFIISINKHMTVRAQVKGLETPKIIILVQNIYSFSDIGYP